MSASASVEGRAGVDGGGRLRWLVGSLGVLGCFAIVLRTEEEPARPVWGPPERLVQAAGVTGGVDTTLDWAGRYAWLSGRARQRYEPLVERIPTPAGYGRVQVPAGGFAAWLRNLPVAPEGTAVTTARGEVVLAADHPNLGAVIALQPRTARLLDGVNMLIRLRAEYCWSAGRAEEVAFHFTSGHVVRWRNWAAGERPFISGREVTFRQATKADAGRDCFCRYLETVFRYASVPSLLADTQAAEDQAIGAGDVVVPDRRRRAALMVLDVATDAEGRVKVLLGRGGRPAHTFHVLQSDAGHAWFPITQARGIEIAGEGEVAIAAVRHW